MNSLLEMAVVQIRDSMLFDEVVKRLCDKELEVCNFVDVVERVVGVIVKVAVKVVIEVEVEVTIEVVVETVVVVVVVVVDCTVDGAMIIFDSTLVGKYFLESVFIFSLSTNKILFI